jgi:hypothetical protein
VWDIPYIIKKPRLFRKPVAAIGLRSFRLILEHRTDNRFSSDGTGFSVSIPLL